MELFGYSEEKKEEGVSLFDSMTLQLQKINEVIEHQSIKSISKHVTIDTSSKIISQLKTVESEHRDELENEKKLKDIVGISISSELKSVSRE